MAEAQQLKHVVSPIKTSGQHSVTLEAVAGTSLESAAANGKVALTDAPQIGEAEAFFPANPAIINELAQNKPVKELASAEQTSSGGLLRTISDVITELRQKHEDRKRTRVQEAQSGSPSQAKFRKGLETAFDSPSKSKGSPLASNPSVATPKRAGSGFSDKVPRMTCWGTSNQVTLEKKPTLAERYSAYKAKQQERKAARVATAATVSNATAQGTVIVNEKATASEAAQTSKKDISADAGVIITPLAE